MSYSSSIGLSAKIISSTSAWTLVTYFVIDLSPFFRLFRAILLLVKRALDSEKYSLNGAPRHRRGCACHHCHDMFCHYEEKVWKYLLIRCMLLFVGRVGEDEFISILLYVYRSSRLSDVPVRWPSRQTLHTMDRIIFAPSMEYSSSCRASQQLYGCLD